MPNNFTSNQDDVKISNPQILVQNFWNRCGLGGNKFYPKYTNSYTTYIYIYIYIYIL